MLFTSKNKGKWIATKNSKIVAKEAKLSKLMKIVDQREDRKDIKIDIVPSYKHFAG